MDVVVWSDYLCPWCYLGLSMWEHLEERHGAVVEWRPYEVHPDIPEAGVPYAKLLRPGGPLDGSMARLLPWLEEAGLTYRQPERVPNTHVALEASLWVQANQPDIFGAFHRSLYEAHWTEGGDIGDPGTVVTLAAAAGADGVALSKSLRRAEHSHAVDRSTAEAADRGVTGTPAWLLAGRLLIPGAQTKETFDRTVERLKAKGLA